MANRIRLSIGFKNAATSVDSLVRIFRWIGARSRGHGCSRSIIVAACLALAGCATTDFNPPAPRTNTGYVDFYTDSSDDLSWEVKRLDEQSREMKTIYFELTPVPGTVLRLPQPPGNHQFQVWFLNCVTQGPQIVRVQVEAGKVTPVHVTLSAAGTTSVDQKVYSFRGSAKGYARGTKITSDQNDVFKIGAEACDPKPYQPKEQMPYFSAGPSK
jgi:hypothetical protein